MDIINKNIELEDLIILNKEGLMKGTAYEDEELSCSMEGCNGTQYIVEWEDGSQSVVCGKSLKWLSDTKAQII